ncbi:GH25 family lysozyme [Pectinatus frisingensis]|uniref:GH25 family lysozyme n=1 Tax=Pectinatus frisingensis TaxID=865 RepID=UPI0018C5BD30|nr:GH25 family lysozyme [Pectinatus frisingensis]
MKGIDVSENNNQIDWQAIADSGIEFAIIRASYGKNNIDSKFLENVNDAHAAGLKVGAYHYSYALTPDDALVEAKHCNDVINNAGIFLELPVFFDMEDADDYKANHNFDFSQDNVTAICKNFVDNIDLNCGVYASLSWLTNYIDWQSLKCPVWSAQYNETDDFKGYMWQHTDNVIIAGKSFDGDILYDDADQAN